MLRSRRSALTRLSALLAAAGGTAGMMDSARAEYPTQPIRLVIGMPPGGTTDSMGRLAGRELAAQLTQSVVVENRPGASGILGTSNVVRSKPDGYSLLVVSSVHATTQFLYPSIPYDTDRDLAPVGMIATTPYVLVASPDLPAHDCAGLVELVRANPGKYSFASTGVGTAQHLTGELFKRREKLDLLHVPYDGSAAMLADLFTGRIPMAFDNVAVMTPHIKAGKMKPFAVTGPGRTPLLPDVRTLTELGLADFVVLGWFAMFTTAGTPADVIDRLNRALNTGLAKDSTRSTLAQIGAEPVGGTPARLGEFLRAEETRWGGLIHDLNIKAS